MARRRDLKLGVELDAPPSFGERDSFRYPVFYAGHKEEADRTLPPEKYCSCLFKLFAKQATSPALKSPYGICAKSVYHTRGLKGPGAVSCRYTMDFLRGLDRDILLNYAKTKQLGTSFSTRDALIEAIWQYLHQEEKYASQEEFEDWLQRQSM